MSNLQTTEQKVQESIKSITDQFIKWSKNLSANTKNTPPQNMWLKSECADFYVRNMVRGVISGKPVLCLATLEVAKDYQNKGIFKSFLNFIETNKEHPFKEVEIENILSDKLLDFTLANGFTKKNPNNFTGFTCETVAKKLST